MITIAGAVAKEKLSGKGFYIVSAVGMILVLLLASADLGIMVNGRQLTSYELLVPAVLTFAWLFAAAFGLAISLGTIPEEYRRGTSHLVWIRGVSQPRYHAGLTLGNLASCLVVLGFGYLGLAGFMVIKGSAGDLVRLPPAYLLSAVPLVGVCLLASLASIRLPTMVAGLIAFAVLLAGIAHPLLSTAANALTGFLGTAMRGALTVLPDLYTLQQQAGNLLLGKPVQIHIVLGGLLASYLLAHLLLVIKKKEA